MKILFICAFLPVEFGSGSAMRSFQLLRELQKLADVDVLSANNWPISQEVLAEFKGNYIGHIKVSGRKSYLGKSNPLSQELQEKVDLDKYDVVFSRYYWPAFRLGLFELHNLIVDCDDCDLEMLQNEYTDVKRWWPRRLASRFRHLAFKPGYTDNLKRANALIYSRRSQTSADFPHAFEIPNKLSPVKSTAPECIKNHDDNINILFVGVLNYSPNIDGIDHFLKNIWPTVNERFPKASFTIVGANIKKRTERRWSKHPQVTVAGFVRDIERAYKDADICTVPVYRGGGVHIKIMEAFKYHKPVVMTEESQRGYKDEVIDGQHAMIALTDEEFVEKLGSLIDNSTLRARMAQEAFEVFNHSFSIETDDPTMQKVLTLVHNASASSLGTKNLVETI